MLLPKMNKCPLKRNICTKRIFIFQIRNFQGTRWWQVKHLSYFHPIFGEMIRFDDNIFQMGWVETTNVSSNFLGDFEWFIGDIPGFATRLDPWIQAVPWIEIWTPNKSGEFNGDESHGIPICKASHLTQDRKPMNTYLFITPQGSMGCQNHLFSGPRGVIRRVWCFHRRGQES